MKENKALKAGIWYTVANFITRGASFLTTPLFTRIMTKSDIGAYSNITSWFSVLVIITTFEFCTSLMVARFDFKEEFNKYVSSILFYGSVITIVFYCIVLIDIDFFTEMLSMPAYAIHIIFIYMIVYPGLQAYQYICRYTYNYRGVILTSIVSVLVSIVISLFGTFVFTNKLAGRTLGYYIPLIIINFIIYIYLMIKGKGVSLKYLKYSVSISFPMIWHALAGQVLSAGDRIVITRYSGSEANAMYSVAYTCGRVIYVLWNSMNSAWTPWATQKMDENQLEEMKEATYPYLIFFCLVALFFTLIAPEMLFIMGGTSYLEAKAVLPPVIAGYICQFVYSLYVNCEFYLKKQKRIAIGTAMAAILNLGLNILFVPKFGYVAAAYTTLFGYLCLVIFHYFSVKLLKREKWYDNRFQWSVIAITICLIPVINLLYTFNMLRYTILTISACVLLICLYKKRKDIFYFIQKIL